MTFISMFAGVGGIDLGLERSGHTCVGQVEIDDYCVKVLAQHWPDVPRWRDITTLDPTELPQADLWTAGFPCQDISNAGKREGIRGERSGLFFDLLRLVRQVRPRYLLLENVAALLARGMDTVLGELAESGYDAEWDCIPAAAVGAPHIRNRVFILAHADRCKQGRRFQPERRQNQRDSDVTGHGAQGDVADAEVPAQRPGLRQDEPEGQRRRRPSDGGGEGDVPDAEQQRPQGSVADQRRRLGDFRESVGTRQWAVECDLGELVDGLPAGLATRIPGRDTQRDTPIPRVATGIPKRVLKLKAMGNAVVPQVAEYIGRHWLGGQGCS